MLKLFIRLAVVAAVGVVLVAAGGYAAYFHFARGLPDHQQLATYTPSTLTRVHAGDGRVLAEFAIERRLFVPIHAIPRRVIDAFLSAEDKGFYSHSGLSLPDIARAAVVNLLNYAQNRRPVGASTITQQVAKNFLLTNEVSIERKVREALLALRIEEALSKDQILELYLNEIYLGSGAYGVAAAALLYFNKSLDELSVAEAAYLAALPKAPNNYHPVRAAEAARARRDWAIGRMREDGAITEAEAAEARAQPLVARTRVEIENARGDYFVEEVRRELMARFGEAQLYRGGLSVRTSLDPRLQEVADRALRRGLIAYDRRHGWRGPIARIDAGAGWEERLAAVKVAGLAPWRLAMVVAPAEGGAEIAFADKSRGFIPLAEMRWARATLEGQKLGPEVRKAADVAAAGDVVAVEALEVQVADARGPAPPPGRTLYGLRQIPNVSGGLVALDPHTGRVLAMSGGWSFEISQFNRATQAQRQPGSSIKPFVYLTALDNGFAPASLIMDGPIVIDQGAGREPWKPSNYTRDFLGPTTLRAGIEKSRNLMTVRLANHIGMRKVADTIEKFKISDRIEPVLAMSLGAGETTVTRMTTAYAMLVNGGLRITPSLIDRVEDRNGKVIFRQDRRGCAACRTEAWANQEAPRLPDERERVVSAQTAYQMVSILQGVVDRGTAVRLKELKRPLAGKTGTTNDYTDAWFVGFTPDFAAGVYVGFDQPRTLGNNETGSAVAVPIFRDFMAEATKDEPRVPFRVPPGLKMIRINPQTGQLARAGDPSIWEPFRPGTESLIGGPVLDDAIDQPGLNVPAGEATGLY